MDVLLSAAKYGKTLDRPEREWYTREMPPILPIESLYQERIAAMTPAERVARSAALFVWTRQQIQRQITAEHGSIPENTLKWLVALRIYGAEPVVRVLIEKELARFSS